MGNEKIEVMASDGRACHVNIQRVQLEKVDTLLYLGSLITEISECHSHRHIRAWLGEGQAIRGS